MDFIRRWVGQTDRFAGSFPGATTTPGAPLAESIALRACRLIVGAGRPACLPPHRIRGVSPRAFDTLPGRDSPCRPMALLEIDRT